MLIGKLINWLVNWGACSNTSYLCRSFQREIIPLLHVRNDSSDFVAAPQPPCSVLTCDHSATTTQTAADAASPAPTLKDELRGCV